MLRRSPFTLFMVTLTLLSCTHSNPEGDQKSLTEKAAPHVTSQKARRAFGDHHGGFLARCLETNETITVHPDEITELWSPCSTFKVPHGLIALETGALQDERTVFAWDGRLRRIKSWNQDHDLRSAIRNSVVWFFQKTAQRIGLATMGHWLNRLSYGNHDASSGLENFWLHPGSLKISIEQQVAFWARFAQGDLPFKSSNMLQMKHFIRQISQDNLRYYGKTGTGGVGGEAVLGWWCGILERPGATWVFACRLEGKESTGRVARAVVEKVLRAHDLL